MMTVQKTSNMFQADTTAENIWSITQDDMKRDVNDDRKAAINDFRLDSVNSNL